MTMEIEYLSEEQLASQLRAMYQRVETENENERLRNLLAALLIVNGPMELPADLPKDFTKGWEIRTRRVRHKLKLSVFMTVPARAVA